MSEINSISSLRPVDNNTPVRQTLPAPMDPNSSAKTGAPSTDRVSSSTQEKAQFDKAAANEMPTTPKTDGNNSPQPLVRDMANVSLQFRVDAKTKDVTIFVIDRTSKKVLRSIPPGELSKMQAGDLLKLTA